MMQTWEQLQTIQPNVVRMLTNSILKDRVAHAYLFEGGRGTGKKEISIQFAKSCFCNNKTGAEPCHVCIECKRIDSGNHPDVLFISPDGLSLKKEQIIELQREFSKKSVEAKGKIYILEHADKMTTQAANSLLKFLEEPSGRTVAILLTEQVQQILPTILSRCQILNFKPLPPDLLLEKLIEQGVPNHLGKLVSSLTNNLNEALGILSDEWFAQARTIVIQLNEFLIKRGGSQALLFLQEKWMPHFKEKEQLNTGLDLLLLWFKDLLYILIGKENNIIYIDQTELLEEQSVGYSQKKIADHLALILEAKKRLNANVNPSLLMEQLILKLQEG
ncbi:DNA polymerase III subunit delta' [Calidifontibacillus erzurumensis]|uniref:DNA polymerase III subunit delta' n=1 Tax=Calidifontibacillus erzurumensis TaxID=2741433 RepID=A0A8J8KCQ5_9BACI|nr:DNA polymerase III subunit delta' [Calidifontibacillus erzurumensis]NSL52867.1 DNA polymerase III subunit delta' [Calidifontibacillus erzurumensis]